MRKKEYNFFY